MRFFVHSSLTKDHLYHLWSRPSDPNMSPEIIGEPVMIRGGANVATFPDSKFGRHTPHAVMTEVTEAQMDYLNQCPAFEKHVKRGFLTVTSSKHDPERIVKDMEKKDGSAPLTPSAPEFNRPDPNPEDGAIATTSVRTMKGGA